MLIRRLTLNRVFGTAAWSNHPHGYGDLELLAQRRKSNKRWLQTKQKIKWATKFYLTSIWLQLANVSVGRIWMETKRVVKLIVVNLVNPGLPCQLSPTFFFFFFFYFSFDFRPWPPIFFFPPRYYPLTIAYYLLHTDHSTPSFFFFSFFGIIARDKTPELTVTTGPSATRLQGPMATIAHYHAGRNCAFK